jgi:hypothetical protein
MYFDITKFPTTTILDGSAVSFDIRPKAGLPVGTYNETITITGTNVSVEVDASFTVVPAEYKISAAPLDLIFTNPITEQTVTITNKGTGAVTLVQPTAASFDIGSLSKTNVAVTETATFTVKPKAALGRGIHAETIAITGSNGASSSVVAITSGTGGGGGGGCNVGYGLLALAMASSFVIRRRK